MRAVEAMGYVLSIIVDLTVWTAWLDSQTSTGLLLATEKSHN